MMIDQHRAGGPALARKIFVLPVVLAVVLVVACNKTQAPDAADQAKLHKEMVDLKYKKLILSGALKKGLSLQLPDTAIIHLEYKRKWELLLQAAEQNEQNKSVIQSR